MNQDIIALSIVFLAAVYAIYSIIKTLRIKSSGSCGDSCSCSAKSDIKKMLKNSQKMPSGKLRIG
ncbi:MAG: FeoB-associated Cys-rich membrane protein [Bacteroidales bacterium]|nr:FeoB-associated Cys-rich membrane protein [Bacteroidales bacterium]